MMKNSLKPSLYFFVCISSFLFFQVDSVSAATLLLSSSSGTFETESTFTVSLFLNTEEKVVNALDVTVSFPPDKLQLVSPSTGQSVVGIWIAPPFIDNQKGTINFQGGIPGGLQSSKALITTLTFRAKAIGTAPVRILDSSRVLLHDGQGTDALRNKINGVYTVVLPPPAGPEVFSITHPDYTAWYSNNNVTLTWIEESSSDGYSYLLNAEPMSLPDDVSEGAHNTVSYENTEDGIHYFHIKAQKGGRWGGVSHFPIKIDSRPPASFSIEVIPSKKTTTKRPVIQFFTTDDNSGINHYEAKIIPLEKKFGENESFFFEVQNPLVSPELTVGTYDIIVRAYDKTGNYNEATERVAIVGNAFEIAKEENRRFIPLVFALLVILILIYIGWRIRTRHRSIDS